MTDYGSKRHLMIDIETLGNKPGCVVTSIGAVVGTLDNGIDDTFHIRIDPANAQSRGLTLDADTVRWWMQQSSQAQLEVTGGTEPLGKALHDFRTFIESRNVDYVWGNAPTFDCAILRAAYEAVGKGTPWSYRQERCFRTLGNLLPQPHIEREGTHHNGLDDAIYQFKVLESALTQLNNATQVKEVNQ